MKTHKPLVAGDRVKVYKEGKVVCGTVQETVPNLKLFEWIGVVLDNHALIFPHYKQCRRIVKRKRREYFIVLGGGLPIVREKYEDAMSWIADGGELIKVREVFKK